MATRSTPSVPTTSAATTAPATAPGGTPTTVSGVPADAVAGQVLTATVVDTEGVDLLARALVGSDLAALAAPAGV